MEAAEDPEFLKAMRRARIRGALVGVESVTPEGLKEVYKDFNVAGDDLVDRLRRFRQNGVAVLGSFIFGLASDEPATFAATVSLAERAEVAFAQFVMLTPLPGTVDFNGGARAGERCCVGERSSADPILAHPAVGSAQGLSSSPNHVR